MKKIRINELARELEVKAHEILERLPELGVSEKKTHSSSIDEDVAIKLRQYYGQDVPDYVHDPNADDSAEGHDGHEAHEGHEEAHGRCRRRGSGRGAPVRCTTRHPPRLPRRKPRRWRRKRGRRPRKRRARWRRSVLRWQAGRIHPPVGPQAAVPARPAKVRVPLRRRPRRAFRRRRPRPRFCCSSGAARAAVTLRRPPYSHRAVRLCRRPSRCPRRRRVPVRCFRVRASHFPRCPRPGAPQRPQVIPRPPQQARPEGQRRMLRVPRVPVRPPQPQRPLAGQPAARPVVPPRPDLVAKLSAPRGPLMPQQPASPRPGVPKAPSTPRTRTTDLSRTHSSRPAHGGEARRASRHAPGASRRAASAASHFARTYGARDGRAAPDGSAAWRTSRAAPRGRPQQRERVEEEKVLRPQRRHVESGPPPISREITISEGITVKELCEKLDVKANMVMKKLMDRGIFVAINQTLDAKLATEVARDFGASTATVSYEIESMQAVEEAEDTKDQVRRAPVVTIMGHVDHGKTSLLDAIREANVAGREAGGITQHIGAYHVEMNGKKIVFIDTPGHEAFTRMRSRGAKVTDIVILVVAADDGVMPQTLEAIDHAKAAGVPIIVAINKIDRPDAQPDRIKQQLSDRGLLAEDWGGDVVMVPVSARTQEKIRPAARNDPPCGGMLDLKANPSRPATGTVIEAQLDRGRGPVATVLVRNGTLRVGDFFICGAVFGKVRAMQSDRGAADPQGRAVHSGGSARSGFDARSGRRFPGGDRYRQGQADRQFPRSAAQRIAAGEEQPRHAREAAQAAQGGRDQGTPVILKADVGGSAEVLTETLQKLSNDKVSVRVIHSGVGAINESDILLASASNAIVIGFNVRPDRKAQARRSRRRWMSACTPSSTT